MDGAIAALVQSNAPDHATHTQEPCDGLPGYVNLHCSCGVGLSISGGPSGEDAAIAHALADAMRLVVERRPLLPEGDDGP